MQATTSAKHRVRSKEPSEARDPETQILDERTSQGPTWWSETETTNQGVTEALRNDRNRIYRRPTSGIFVFWDTQGSPKGLTPNYTTQRTHAPRSLASQHSSPTAVDPPTSPVPLHIVYTHTPYAVGMCVRGGGDTPDHPRGGPARFQHPQTGR